MRRSSDMLLPVKLLFDFNVPDLADSPRAALWCGRKQWTNFSLVRRSVSTRPSCNNHRKSKLQIFTNAHNYNHHILLIVNVWRMPLPRPHTKCSTTKAHKHWLSCKCSASQCARESEARWTKGSTCG
jgi:hypothetical protein